MMDTFTNTIHKPIPAALNVASSDSTAEMHLSRSAFNITPWKRSRQSLAGKDTSSERQPSIKQSQPKPASTQSRSKKMSNPFRNSSQTHGPQRQMSFFVELQPTSSDVENLFSDKRSPSSPPAKHGTWLRHSKAWNYANSRSAHTYSAPSSMTLDTGDHSRSNPLAPNPFLQRHLGSQSTPLSAEDYDSNYRLSSTTASSSINNAQGVHKDTGSRIHINATSEKIDARIPLAEPSSCHVPLLDLHSPNSQESTHFLYHTSHGQKIPIPTKSLCSIQRSASRRSGRDYVGKYRSKSSAPTSISIRQRTSSIIAEQPRGESFKRRQELDSKPIHSAVDLQSSEIDDFWYDIKTRAGYTSSSERSSPLFSESDTSTTPSSPIESSEDRSSMELEGRKPMGSLMRASITRLDDFDSWTPQFMQQRSILPDDTHSATTDTSKTSAKISEEVVLNLQAKALDLAKTNKTEVDDLYMPQPTRVQVNSLKPLSEQSVQPLNIKKQRPHVSALIIPTTPPSNIVEQIYTTKALPDTPNSRIQQAVTPQPIVETYMNPGSPQSSSQIEVSANIWSSHSSIAPTPLSLIAHSKPVFPTSTYTTTKLPISPSAQHNSYRPIVPTRLGKPIQTWHAPQYSAPKGGLQMRISRKDFSTSRQEWVIESAVTSLPILKCLSHSVSLTRKRGFRDINGRHLFNFQTAVGSTRVAENEAGETLFVVRNASLKILPHWTLTHKNCVGKSGGKDMESVQWVAKADEDCNSLMVLWGGFLVGRISADYGQVTRHNYIVTVNPDMNYCMMAALTTVFDDFRVDEGYC